MDFIAVDFETPNSKNDCACSMGITLVENSSIVWTRNVLINPHARFDERNFSVHGISRDMVQDAPNFEEMWAEYGSFFRHYAIVMHNAAFDSSVLKKAAQQARIELPAMDFYCTMRLCTENYNFEKYSLPYICEHFGLCLNHHDAGSDSLNTAKIMLLLLDDEKACIHTYSSCSMIPVVSAIPSEQKARRAAYLHPSPNRKLIRPVCDYDALRIEIPGKCFAFTGEIPGINRSDAIAFVEENGGIVSSTVSKKIDYLVIGLEDAAIVGAGAKSTKITRAEELIACGLDIKLIAPENFRSLLHSPVLSDSFPYDYIAAIFDVLQKEGLSVDFISCSFLKNYVRMDVCDMGKTQSFCRVNSSKCISLRFDHKELKCLIETDPYFKNVKYSGKNFTDIPISSLNDIFCLSKHIINSFLRAQEFLQEWQSYSQSLES